MAKYNPRKEMLKMVGDVSTIGMTVGFSVFIGVWIGHFLDNKVFDGKTSPWLTLIFLGFGIIAAFKNLFLMVKKREKENSDSE
ncbi:MAG: AtpZ/AtpI family protein [Desulfobulbaceae bacterium]|nr:AtpZ/AtpI family protein [Desulfobulbaceae bacterium]MCK5404841.1 AtpZ/AtpI family protein [Desulfobulbaceae bacterium]